MKRDIEAFSMARHTSLSSGYKSGALVVAISCVGDGGSLLRGNDSTYSDIRFSPMHETIVEHLVQPVLSIMSLYISPLRITWTITASHQLEPHPDLIGRQGLGGKEMGTEYQEVVVGRGISSTYGVLNHAHNSI